MRLPYLPLLLLVSTLGTAPLSFAASNFELLAVESLPDLGNPANTSLSTTQEIDFGKQLFRELRQSERFIEDPELVEWINLLGQRLASKASGKFSPFYFAINQDNSINAYSMPGGVVIMNAGLITNARSESEVAAVLAHEIAHVTQRHIARQLYNAKANPLIMGAGLLAGAAIASKNPDAGEAVMMGTLATSMHKQLSFSRAHETEADRVGLRILAASGFSPSAMANFLEQLDRGQSSLYGDIAKYLSSHPLGLDRISDVRSHASHYKIPIAPDSNQFKFMQTKLRSLTKSENASGDAIQARYASALSALRYGQAQNALTLAQKLPASPATLLLQAQALNANKRYDETLKRFMPGVRVSSANPLVIPIVDALLATNQTAKAWQLMQSVKLFETTSLEVIERKQQVANQVGQRSEAMLAAAERSLRLGSYPQTKLTLEQALAASPSPATRNAINARLAEVKKGEKVKKQLEKF